MNTYLCKKVECEPNFSSPQLFHQVNAVTKHLVSPEVLWSLKEVAMSTTMIRELGTEISYIVHPEVELFALWKLRHCLF
jgi:hypothetical protein